MWLVGVFGGVPALVISVHGLDTAVVILRTVLQPDGRTEWIGYLGWTVGLLGFLIGGHEALHTLAGERPTTAPRERAAAYD